MKILANRNFAAAVAALALASAAPAMAADAWIACNGTMTSTPDKTAGETQPSQRVLVYDDAARQLYQYSEKRQTLDVMPTKSYDAGKITWAADLTHTGGMRWEGSLDRVKMMVSIKREDNDGVMLWNEQCKPTLPLTGTPVADYTTTAKQ